MRGSAEAAIGFDAHENRPVDAGLLPMPIAPAAISFF
jgi:hypothetical protein